MAATGEDARADASSSKAAPSAAPAIQTVDLTKRYGSGAVAVRALTLTVARGEIFGFLGPNGAGKTTTIRLLLDLIRPTSGGAQVFGLDCNREATEVRRRVGYLPGELSLYKGYTGRRLMELIAALRPGQVSRDYVTEICDRLRVELESPVGQLSHGNRQKVGLVMALMPQPDLLVLDEPTTGLDPLARHEVLELLRDVKEEGRTVFLSSHNLPEVERVCDRVGIIRSGQLVAAESVEAVRARRVQRLRISFAERVPPDAFASLPGVQLLERDSHGTAIRFEVAGDVDPIVKAAAAYHAVSIDAEQPSLEEAFMAYYERSEPGPAGGGADG